MCKPVLPIVKDITSHVFWATEHITTVHVHNGDQHVHSEIEEITKNTEDGKSTQTPQTSEPVSFHLLSNNNYDIPCQFNTLDNFWCTLVNYTNQFLEIEIPPPRV